MRPIQLSAWVSLHKWSGLIAMLVMLAAFVSGLPLIYRAEIESWLDYGSEKIPDQGVPLPLDRLVEAAEQHSSKVVQFVVWDDDKPSAITLSMASSRTDPPYDNVSVLVSARTGRILTDKPGPLSFFDDLHTQLLMGNGGTFVLGIFALSFLLSVISGWFIYAPFAGRRPFTDIRRGRGARTTWLDMHNVLGILVLGWLLVVGGTGLINTWGAYLVKFWQAEQVAEMTKAYKHKSPPDISQMAAVEVAYQASMQLFPGRRPWFIAMPGSVMSDRHHYSIYLREGLQGKTHLVRPVLVDALTATVTDSREMPWYMKMLLLSQPLHFGDYGGPLLKIIWALFTLISITVLISGIYLWWHRCKLSQSLKRKLITG